MDVVVDVAGAEVAEAVDGDGSVTAGRVFDVTCSDAQPADTSSRAATTWGRRFIGPSVGAARGRVAYGVNASADEVSIGRALAHASGAV